MILESNIFAKITMLDQEQILSSYSITQVENTLCGLQMTIADHWIM